MGCSQSNAAVFQLETYKARQHEEFKLKNKTDDTAENTRPRKNSPSLDLDSLYKSTNIFSTALVHIEAANTSDNDPYGKPIEHFYDGICDKDNILGSGISGTVRECTHKKTGHKYAVKSLDLDKIGDEKGLEHLKSEILIMSELDHPSIVRLEEVYESRGEIYLVQELCHGGELFDKLEAQEDYHYSEGKCARLVKQMLSSVRYIHSKGIVHRDLKLENFLFSTKENDSELKLIDFGLSKHFHEGEIMSEAVGTPYTIAPETMKGQYDERVDLWAIGVITYLLLSGETPFGGNGGEEPLWEVRDRILSGKYEFEPDYIWRSVSDSAKDFINGLLKLDPDERISSAEQAQQHHWILGWNERCSNGSQSDTLLSPNVMKNLIEFKGYGDMRKLLCEVLSFTLLPDQIHDLKKEFEILDKEGSGEISLESLKTVLMASAADGSLGALMDDEVEDIFNAMRFKKTSTTIRWHEFIAASLSLCRVDDRNLRIAFDRLDSDHKGYISLENVMAFMGYAEDKKGAIREMYETEMITSEENKDDGIKYEDFVLLMKGQKRNGRKKQTEVSSLRSSSKNGKEGSKRLQTISIILPECHNNTHSKGKSDLEVNRNLYRNHRQMRINILEASKRFEQLEPLPGSRTQSDLSCMRLPMKTNIQRRPSEAMPKLRSRRTKTKSDLAGMGISMKANTLRQQAEVKTKLHSIAVS